MSEHKKMGRPKAEDPRINRIEIKFNNEELKKLDKLCLKKGLTRSELIRYLIEKTK